MRLVGGTVLKGFLLKKELEFKEDLMVLIGKNGSGKTRFLESLQSGSGTNIIFENGFVNREIKYFSHQGLIPSIAGGYSEELEAVRLATVLDYLRRHGSLLDYPELDGNVPSHLVNSFANDINFEEVHRIVWVVASKLGKIPSQLKTEEVKSFYDGNRVEIFGVTNLAAIFTRYKEKISNNEFAQWKSERKNKDLFFVKDGDVESFFGCAPWDVLNEILDVTFNGKLKVGVPDLDGGKIYDVRFYVCESGSESDINVSDLSSGEKTLLWLTLVLFNTQFSVVPSVRPPQLLVLDEPDAFLHPSMVAQLMAFFQEFSRKFSAQVIITTHSPTTVALAPEESVRRLENGIIEKIDKDAAIACLLEGVSQISISPFNRRQVFVESSYDADIYQTVYGKISHREDLLDPKVTLTFVSSGPKMPRNQTKDKLYQVFGKGLDEEKVSEFLRLVNGVGCCDQVVGMVNELSDEGSVNVRGLIDWDSINKSGSNIVVLGEDKFYAIENVSLDPICIMAFVTLWDEVNYPRNVFCGRDIGIHDWLRDADLLQKAMDWFIGRVLKSDNRRDCELLYVSGVCLRSDSRYLKCNEVGS